MQELQNICILFIFLFFTRAILCENSYAVVEIEDENNIDVESDKLVTHSENIPNSNQQIKRGKILWPYPLHDQKSNNETKDNNKVQKEEESKERFLYSSYKQNHLMDMMMKKVASNYSPTNLNDPFEILRDSYPLPKGYNKVLDEYDYIIIGASSAGSVLAARLSEEKPKAMVLLIEAGKPEMLLSDIPALAPHLQLTDYSWPYTMEYQPGVCMGSEEGRCHIIRGKAVGGSSVINYMLYARGRPEDWNRIAGDGNYGWSYADVLQYYLKSEKADLNKKYNNSRYHGLDGELSVENIPFRTGLVEAFLEAGRIFGHHTVDYNSPDQFGFGYVQTTTSKGHRMSSAKAFLHSHKRRRNLHILSQARAAKIIIEPKTKRAYAVEYYRNNIKYIARSRREIILSAGPISSPQLLMLSGIGPQEHLASLGIPIIKDLNVGRTLYDHIGFPGVIFKLNSTNASLLESKVATLPNLMQWMQYGEGLLTSPSAIEAIGYVKTNLSLNKEQIPDIELINLGGSFTSDSGTVLRKSWRISDETYLNVFESLNEIDTWSAIPILLHPKSKGYLELRDANPFSHPKIYGNYLTDHRDINTMIEGIKLVIKLGESSAFKKYNPKLYIGEYSTCKSYSPGSDEYWECALKTLVISMNHQIATCKMGPPNDPYAVVDPELRVYGVEGLRVVDSSIIPRTISAHSDSPAVMIGEKAADLIRNTWSNQINKV